METMYTFNYENNEVVFTKEEEVTRRTKEELIEVMIKVLGYSHEDAEFYTTWLNNQTLKMLAAYNNEFNLAKQEECKE